MNKIKQNNQGKKGYLLYFFATNLRQSRAFRMQFIFSGWGLRPQTPSRGFATAPCEGALRRPPRPPACFRYFSQQLKSSLIIVIKCIRQCRPLLSSGCLFSPFYAPSLKGLPGASSNRIVRPSVRPFVCPSVRNSGPLTNKVQCLKFGWSYSNQTWTVSSSMGSSHFTDITCP